MTLLTGLPVFKTSYDMLLKVVDLVDTFPKKYKYTLWDEIKKELIRLISMIYRANSSQENRLKYLWTARESVEVLKLYVRLVKDLKIFRSRNRENN
jgi:hypothetical protein